jgi:SAM-dependent methyltransferase
MNYNQWNEIAEPYCTAREEEGTELFNFLLPKLKEKAPNRIFDFGGGNGTFSAEYLAPNFRYIDSFDPCPAITRAALETCAAVDNVNVLADLNFAKWNTYDCVTMNAVWMCLKDRTECLGVLKNVNRLLVENGTFFAVVTHPCFRDSKFSTYITDFDATNYFRDGTRFNVDLLGNKQRVRIRDTHWSLGAMSEQLVLSGFNIEQLIEMPDESDSVGPPWLIIVAIKRGANK